MNLEFCAELIFLDRREVKGVTYLARRRDIDEGRVLVVVVLVRRGVRTLWRGQRLGNT